MMHNDACRIHVRAHGRVQGVGFRWFVVTEAERLQLRGWVQNTPEGAVELEAEGAADAIALFRQRISQGPPAARVTQIEDLPVSSQPLAAGFQILR